MNLTTLSRMTLINGVRAEGDNANRFAQLISGASGAIIDKIGRRFDGAILTEVLDGPSAGFPYLQIANPVARLIDVKIGMPGARASVPLADVEMVPALASASLGIKNNGWARGRRTVEVTYQAGFLKTLGGVIPASGNLTWRDPMIVGIVGVLIDGVAATATDSAPSAGQYRYQGDGVFSFSAADAGKSAAVDAAIVPPPLELACCDMVNWADAARSRAGQTSKSLGGQETVSFSQASMSTASKEAVDRYRRP